MNKKKYVFMFLKTLVNIYKKKIITKLLKYLGKKKKYKKTIKKFKKKKKKVNSELLAN